MTTTPTPSNPAYLVEVQHFEERLGELWDRMTEAYRSAAGQSYGSLYRATQHIEGAWRALGYAREVLND